MSAKFDRRHFIAAGTTALALPFVARSASAQGTWPSRQIRMICSYPAGGQTDLLARAYGEFISKQVGKTVVVENKPGASGAIGTAEVARAEPDGHTVLCSISTTYIMNRVVMKNPGYDMDKDLTLVSVIPGAGLLLVANPKTGVKTLEDFVALPPSPLEEREKLEQLRALEAGMSIAVARVDEAPLSVDTPADLERARKILS